MKQTKKEMLQGIEEQVEMSRLIGSNTLMLHYKDGRKAVRYHTTDIVTEMNDVITLNSGGWKTVTTKEGINQYGRRFGEFPAIIQRNHQWFIGEGIFYDGIQFKNGQQISLVQTDNKTDRDKMLRKIKKYVDLITEDNLPIPNNGDCWYCLMTTDKDKKTLGDAFGDTSHLISHLEEGYVVGSLLVSAMRESGWGDMRISAHYGMKWTDSFKKAVKKYLIKRLVK
jgi:hypothetical protein